MNPQEKVQEIEVCTDVRRVVIDGLAVWPIFKSYLFTRLRSESFASPSPQRSKKLILSWAFSQLWASLAQFARLCRPAHILISTNAGENRPIGNHYRNKLFFKLVDRWKGEILLLEKPNFLNPTDQSDRTVSLLPLVIAVKLLVRLRSKKLSTTHAALAQIPANRIAQEFCLYRVFWRLFLSLKRPKVVLLSNYYNNFNFALIAEAKARSIPVIELQHGIISELHPAYNYPGFKDATLLPDYLAYYFLPPQRGDSFFLSSDKLLYAGHPYLESLKNLSALKKPSWNTEGRNVVAVTLQGGHEENVIRFVEAAAESAREFFFVLIPRNRTDAFQLANKRNVTFETGLNFYECLNWSQIHCTFSSTCTIEAWMSGIPSVVIEINDIARKYYESLLDDSALVYVKEPHQLNEACQVALSLRERKAQVYAPGHVHLEDFLGTLLKKI